LLIKRRDEYVDSLCNIEGPKLVRSVLAGRALKEIEEGRPRKRRQHIPGSSRDNGGFAERKNLVRENRHDVIYHYEAIPF
jgi:hypothetical protein